MRSKLAMSLVSLTAAVGLAACGGSTRSSNHASSASAGTTSSSATSASATVSTTSSGASAATTGSSGSPQLGYESVPLEQGPPIAPASTTQTVRVDGITCGPTEQLAYHIHAHLAVFDHGRVYSLPPGVGIPGSAPGQTQYGPVASGGQCIYWLHTHTADGIIHVESPTQRIYTLGDFFDIWHQPLTDSRVGTLSGHVIAYFNGKPWTQNVRAIPLVRHALIQLEIGQPTPPLMTVNWSRTGL